MKNKTHQRFLALIMTFVMAAACLVSPVMAAWPDATSTADTDIVSALPEATPNPNLNQRVTIMVQLEGETTYMRTSDLQLAAAGYDSQMAAMVKAEQRIEKTLSQSVEIENRYSLLFNGFSFTGEAWMIDSINKMDGLHAFEAPVFELIEAQAEEEVNLTPSMGMSTGLVRATNAWDLGYTGKGMVVGVIDTGIRQTHEAFSVAPEGGRIDQDYLETVYATYGDKIHAGTSDNIDDIYYSGKLPFNWDYFDSDHIPNHTVNDHGSHVAGIVAGNNGDDFKGVAPDAQIATFQVFTDQGSASFDTLMLALEDCVYLGVDAVNMSLGAAAWFSSYESITTLFEDIYDALGEAGIAVCAAAGNDGTTTYWNNLSTGGYDKDWFAWNPDVGTIGAPSTFPGSLAVASVVNADGDGTGYFTAYGKEYYPTAISGVPNFGGLENRDYEIVYVGLCTPEEIEAAGGVEGKIALTQRGVVSFVNKVKNAADAGAAACLIFNNVSGTFNPSVSGTIPFGAMSMEEGLDLVSRLEDGVRGIVTVNNGLAYLSLSMASTSSWGTTADLLIKPEITAPGSNIRSVNGFSGDTAYKTSSGTSMATPHVAGGMLLIKQRLQELYPEKTPTEINDLAHNFMMSTAHQVSGMVRQQGAGIMDLEAALTTEAYLTVDGGRPKLELDDSTDGSFTFSFEVHNFDTQSKTYDIVPTVLTEQAGELEYIGYRSTGQTKD